MDEALSRLLPSYKIGSDGFNWWIGQIEALSKDDPAVKGSFRYKVRIVGEHVKTCEIVGSSDLPWASVMMPVTAPMTVGGPVQGAPKLQIGNWVIGFYMDPDKQKPIIMGQMPQLMGATGKINEFKPGECNSFTTYLDPRNNPYTQGPAKVEATTVESGEVAQTEPATTVTPEGSGSTATPGADEAPKAAPPLNVLTDLEEENICVKLADSCGKEKDLGWTFTDLLGDMLAEIQNNNGNIGTALVSRATGEASDAIGDVTKYVNQFIAVTELFLAKVKGIVKNGLKLGVDALVKAILRQDETGNALTPVTEFFNKQLKKLGCEMADIGERLAQFLTDIIMSYVDQIYRAAACQVDLLVNGVLNRIQSELNNLVSEILGFISNILGPVGDALNIIGDTINQILSLLGITCGGGDKRCAKYKKSCTNGGDSGEDEEEDEDNFLDRLLADLEDDIDGIAPNLGFDNTTYTCSDAYTGTPLSNTSVGFIGGTPGSTSGTILAPKIVYEIDDIKVAEGQVAKFTVTRSGSTEYTSSLNFKTIDDTAEAGSDYIKAEGIVVFEKGQVEANIEVFTLNDDELEIGGEDFKVILANVTPKSKAGIAGVSFIKNIGICTIKSKDFTVPPGATDGDGVEVNNPYISIIGDPVKEITDIFPIAEDPGVIGDFDGDGETDDPNAVLYQLLADKTIVEEGDFVVFTINTLNVPDGTIVPWIISGTNITTTDIVGGELSGYAVIDSGTASVVVGIEEDAEIEIAETMTFTLSGKAQAKNVVIASQKNIDDFDIGVGEDDESVIITEPEEPEAGDPVTDPIGGIITIPVKKPGGPYVIPPYVTVGGGGYGATAQALLDPNGFVTEIRVTNPGVGYKLNGPETNGLRCIIDAFTMIRPGQGYTSAPTVWINGRDDVAEAIVEDGRVVSVRILDRETTFEEYPEVLIIGGGGQGAKWIPSFACLDTPTLAAVGSTKIGTGRYVDCP